MTSRVELSAASVQSCYGAHADAKLHLDHLNSLVNGLPFPPAARLTVHCPTARGRLDSSRLSAEAAA